MKVVINRPGADSIQVEQQQPDLVLITRKREERDVGDVLTSDFSREYY